MTSIKPLLLLFPIFLCSCSSDNSKPQTSSSNTSTQQTQTSADESIPVGSLQSHKIAYQFAVYYLPKASADPIATLDGLLADQFKTFRKVNAITGAETVPTLAARIDNDPQKEYAPPSLEMIQRFGRGLTGKQAAELQTTDAVCILDFFYTSEQAWDHLRTALQLTSDMAAATDGLIWDESTREVFTPAAWNERRIDRWTEPVPDVSNYSVIHAYKNGDYVRAITLGMAKFGLPDIVVDQFSWSTSRNMGHVVNLFGQTIAEGSVVERPGEFDLDFRRIRHPNVREPQIDTLKPNATGTALLTLKMGTWEEGDPKNRLVEITFDRGTGPDLHARQEHILAAAFGFEDSITDVKHDEALNTASQQARQTLPALRDRFNKGLPPGEYVQLKAPFDTSDGGKEWMWVEVATWEGDKITGLLSNEPFRIPTLHAGQTVEISESKVFDYIHKRADGTLEGNETGKLIGQQSQ